jgi:hypothetical protein
MAVVKVVPFPGALGPRGPIGSPGAKGDRGEQGPAGQSGLDGVASAEAPLTYEESTRQVGIDQDGFSHLGNLDYLDFSEAAATPTRRSGRMHWDEYHETLKLGVGSSGTLNLGQELQMTVFNLSGSDLPLGTIVMCELDNSGNIRTVEGGMFRVIKAIVNGNFPSKLLLGVTAEGIGPGTKGVITTHGHIHNFDTSPYQLGQILWANPAVPGGFTTTPPIAPNLKLPIATVTNISSTEGTIYVRMTQGSELGVTDSNVQITNPQNGDVLKYNASSKVWYNAQP